MSTSTVSRIERGHAGSLALDTLFGVAAALETRIDLVPRWRGGDLDRMLGAAHGRMHEQVARVLRQHSSWIAAPEVSFSVYGERGAIDLLAYHAGRQALLVVELKTQLIDIQELLSAVDRYRRLAPQVAAARGWEARNASVWVALRDTTTNRRRLAAHVTVLRSAMPHDGRSVRGWLREPEGRLAALSFLPDLHARNARSTATAQHRVRLPIPRSAAPPTAPERASASPIPLPNGPPVTP